MKITFLSDTHNKHKQILPEDLPGGHFLIHCGDITSTGYNYEIQYFLDWFSGVEYYSHKIFIAGNHDIGFQERPDEIRDILKSYSDIVYLEDDEICLNDVKIYGSPWQPEHNSWGFNLPRNGPELTEKWNMIPSDIDILLTHGPAYGYLDRIMGQYENLGCERLIERINTIRPKIHACGHIHTGYGHKFVDWQEYEKIGACTHFINAANLDETYRYTQKPISVEWFLETNTMEFLHC